jgi:predicted permease
MNWFGRLFRRGSQEADLDAELHFHIEQRIADLKLSGLSEEQARRRARLEFGGTEQVKEDCRDARGTGWVEDLWQDLRYGLRLLRRSPAFTLVTVITLALGMGATTAILTLVNTFALRRLPVRDPDSIVHIWMETDGGERLPLFSYRDYLEYRERNHTLADLVASNKVTAVLGNAPPGPASNDGSTLAPGYQYAFGQIVSANYFDTLDAGMRLGRPFSGDEDMVPGERPVVVLSHSFWRRRLQADAAIIGKTIQLSGTPFTVVGVTAANFVGTEPQVPDFWAPIMMRDALVQGWLAHTWYSDRNARCLTLLGRLRRGVSREAAQADLSVIGQQLTARGTSRLNKGPIRVSVTSGATFFDLADYRALVIPLFLAVGLVLLVACANVANLLLSRASGRQLEISLRLSLGSSRTRLIRQLLTESVLLALLGGASALALSLWSMRAICPVILDSLALPSGLAETLFIDPQPDARVFALTLLLSLVTGILFGLAPAVATSHTNLGSGLKGDAGRGQPLNRSRMRNWLVMIQVAMSIVLLISAALLIRSVRRLSKLDMGLSTEGVFSVSAGLSGGKDARRESQLRHQLLIRMKNLPGIVAAAEARRVPLTGALPSAQVTVPGEHSFANSMGHPANYNLVSADYFAALKLRIVRGRVFTPREADMNLPVVLVSESAAKRFWPGQDPIGKRITLGSPGREMFLPDREVIGMVRDARSSFVWRQDDTLLYYPASAGGRDANYVLVRLAGAGHTRSLEELVRREARLIDRNLAVSVRRVGDSLDYQMAPFRACAALAGALGTLALLMASVGLYGVISYLVGQRTREFGIRVALGATRRELLELVLRSGMRLVLAGTAVGAIAAVLVSRLFASVLIDLSPLDPVAYAMVALLISAVALAACLVPARRAARVDPIVALHYE